MKLISLTLERIDNHDVVEGNRLMFVNADTLCTFRSVEWFDGKRLTEVTLVNGQSFKVKDTVKEILEKLERAVIVENHQKVL